MRILTMGLNGHTELVTEDVEAAVAEIERQMNAGRRAVVETAGGPGGYLETAAEAKGLPHDATVWMLVPLVGG